MSLYDIKNGFVKEKIKDLYPDLTFNNRIFSNFCSERDGRELYLTKGKKVNIGGQSLNKEQFEKEYFKVIENEMKFILEKVKGEIFAEHNRIQKN